MWQVRGHDQVARQLETSFKAGRLAHAYLLVGPPHVGKMTLALNVTQMVNCLQPEEAPCGQCLQCRRVASGHHADVHILALERDREESSSRKEISIGQVREVQHQANLRPYEGKCRVIIVDGAEYMSEEAANSLLKLLEEPPSQVLLLLLASWEEALLPTVRSRCQRVELWPMARQQVVEELMTRGVESDQAEKLARLSSGCLGWALTALEDPSLLDQREAEMGRIERITDSRIAERFDYASSLTTMFYRDRDSLTGVLYLWLRWWRDILLVQGEGEGFVYNSERLERLREQARVYSKEEVVPFLHVLHDTLQALEQNANPRLALEVMMLKMPQGVDTTVVG